MINIIEKIKFIPTSVLAFLLSATLAFAQGSPGQFASPIGPQNFSGIINAIVDVVIEVGIVVIILAIIYSGYLFVTAQGNDEKISTAKKTFYYVIIGTIILLGARQLSVVLQNTASEFN
jgi:uncharacterized membrane protein